MNSKSVKDREQLIASVEQATDRLRLDMDAASIRALRQVLANASSLYREEFLIYAVESVLTRLAKAEKFKRPDKIKECLDDAIRKAEAVPDAIRVSDRRLRGLPHVLVPPRDE